MAEQIANLCCPVCGAKSGWRYTTHNHSVRRCTNEACGHVFHTPTYDWMLYLYRNHETFKDLVDNPFGVDNAGRG